MHSTDISSVRTSQKSDAGLSCNNLSRQISGSWIWSKINLHLAPGDKLALTGSSGSGKSLLLRTLAGLDVIESGLSGEAGTINFDGISLHDWEMPQYRTKVSYIPQNPVFFDETVETNLKRAFQLKAHQHRRYDQNKFWRGWNNFRCRPQPVILQELVIILNFCNVLQRTFPEEKPRLQHYSGYCN